MESERARLEAFLDKFSPPIAREARLLLKRLQARMPGANLLVYDNYNALAIGFAPSTRASDVILSVAIYPKWLNLFFMRGPQLSDPYGLLRGEGVRVRHVPHVTAASLEDPRVDGLIIQALALAGPALDPSGHGTLIIKSVSEKQRSRRPA